MANTTARILIVDDNEDNRFMLSERLAVDGYRDIATAQDGHEALALLQSRSFDCVLLDIMMPGMNGFEVLDALRRDPRNHAVPVIVISAADQFDAAIRSIELGAIDYLPKPFNPTLLRARVGAVLEKKRMHDALLEHVARIDRELKFARDLQLSMVPSNFAAIAGGAPYAVHAALQPARAIGGDFYDYFWLATGRLCVVVADVADKGVSAALFMARTKTALRLLSRQYGEHDATLLDAARLIRELNDELVRENPHTMYVTMVVCIIDVTTGDLTWYNAGHPPPLLIAPDGRVERLSGSAGIPLGLRAGVSFEAGSTKMAKATSLFVYTDGITESADPGGALFGLERLERSLRASAHHEPELVLDTVLKAVQDYSGAREPNDDIAAVICQRLE
jgi:sigma-B regulation protein RsbU (phosphoserine phosphatase)